MGIQDDINFIYFETKYHNCNRGCKIMYLKRVELKNFRNYSSLKISFNKGINIIYGNNAQGKTNLLESIYVLALTNTFRNVYDTDLIMKDRKFFNIKGILKNSKLDTTLNISYDNIKKRMMIDDSEIMKVSNYISVINTILFTPDDLDIIKGPPLVRRKFLNTELSQLYSNYYILLSEYEKILKMRNDYIKSGVLDINYYDIITSFLIEKDILIFKIRKKFIERINNYAAEIFKNITGLTGFKIVYKPNLDYSEYDYDKNKILEVFKDKYDSEYKFLSTFYGIHKDDFEFYLGDSNLKIYGSQGQMRISVLTLKLSEIEIFKKWKDSTPILLLDDVFSEIDEIKNNNLLYYLSRDLQVIITSVSLSSFNKEILSKAKVFRIESGKIKLDRLNREVKDDRRTL